MSMSVFGEAGKIADVGVSIFISIFISIFLAVSTLMRCQSLPIWQMTSACHFLKKNKD